MPSPFPGMDPFLESQEWEDFHTRLNTIISELLSPRLEPRYIVRIERRVYVESRVGDYPPFVRSDAAVLKESEAAGGRASGTGSATMLEPFECQLPMSEQHREVYLVIRLRKTMEVITVLETLSPGNKRARSDGRREYQQKREAVAQSPAHLVEFDLLRGGLRLPAAPLPPADYFAIVSRRETRPKAAVYAWTLRDPLPTIPVPLKKGDPDVPLDLQTALTTVYDRARYDLSLDYSADLQPPLTEADAQWAQPVLRSFKQ